MTTGKTGTTAARAPRRSKAAKPVTIDLKAEEVKSTAPEDGTAPPTDSSAKQAARADPAEKTGDNKAMEKEDGDKAQKEAPSPKSAAGASASAGKSAEKGGGSGNGLTGGLIGGGVAFLAMLGIQFAGLMPSSNSDVAAGGADIKLVSTELGQLRTTVDQLSSTVSQLPIGGAMPDLSTIGARIDALETAAAAGTSPGDADAALSVIENRIAALSEEVADLKSGAGSSAGNGDVVGGLQDAVSALESRTQELSDNLSQLQTGLEDLGNQVATSETRQTELVQSLTARIEKAEAVADGSGRDLAMARAIAISGLKTAIDRGGPFAAELEAFALVSPDDAAIGDLRSLAATGVPTSAQLIEIFPDAANRMIASADPVPDDAGLVARLWSSAQSVVKVRKVGAVEGDSTEAIAARMETQLKNGNLDAAVAEWANLPEEAKSAAADFGRALAARAQVEKLLAAVQIAAPSVSAETIDAASGDAVPKPTE